MDSDWDQMHCAVKTHQFLGLFIRLGLLILLKLFLCVLEPTFLCKDLGFLEMSLRVSNVPVGSR